MNRILSTEVPAHVGRRVRVAGWMHRFRRLGAINFLILRDAGGLAQVVVDEPQTATMLSGLHLESVLQVEGRVAMNAQAPGGAEIVGSRVEVLSGAEAPSPVELFRPALNIPLPVRLDHASVALRHPRTRATFLIAAATVAGFRSALDSAGFVEVHTPKIVASATESGANVFRIDYFGRPAYLAQSPQLYKQMMVGVFERVYEVGPVFRAEPHDTTRHTNEFVSLDVELGFIEDHRGVMDVLTRVLRGMVAEIAARAEGALTSAGARLPTVPERIPMIHFAEAQEMISDRTGEDLTRELDLAPAHERFLTDWSVREHGSEFLLVEGFPMAKRPFYTHPDPDRPGYSRGFDLLFRGVEIVTGGQRLHRYPDYLDALASRGEDIAPYQGYLEAFRHGMPPHGGFAIGLERWVARVVEADNVREATLFPRDINRLTP